MADPFVPTSTPPKSNPTFAKYRNKAAAAAAAAEVEPPNTFEPYKEEYLNPPPTAEPEPEPEPEPTLAVTDDLSLPPEDLMAPTDTSEGLYTDATYDEIEAGKRASESFSRRRKAELDYGKNFLARRKVITGG